MRKITIGTVASLAAAAGAALFAQGRGNPTEWPTTGGDAQRTYWTRSDPNITNEALSQPGFELQWKRKLTTAARGGVSLSPAVTVTGVTLFTPLSTIMGASNDVFALDNDTGNPFWTRHFDGTLPAATAACPGGTLAAATRMANLTPAPLVAAGGGRAGGGRGGNGFSSSVGAPGEGAPVPAGRGGGGRGAATAPGAPGAPGAAGAPPAAGAPAAGAPPAGQPPAGAPQQGGRGRGGNAAAGAGAGAGAPGAAPGAPGAAPARGGGGGGGFGRSSGLVYVLAGDGVLHALGFPSGKDIQKPAAFLPANARVSDLIGVNNVVYAATSGNCGGAPNGIWAMDVSSDAKTVTSWKTNGGSPIGSVAFATDGTLIAAVGPGTAGTGGYVNAIVALDPKTLQLKDWYTQPNTEFVSSPLVFREGDKDIVAAATKDGRVLLLEVGSLGGANHSTPAFASKPVVSGAWTPGALAMWQEAINITPANAPAPDPAAGAGAAPAQIVTGGTRWLLVPVAGKLAADVTASNGAVTSGAIVALKVTNDGGKLSLAPGWTSRDVASPITPLVVNGVVFAASAGPTATLYAFNGSTGKELWTSGKTITGPLSGRSFWAGSGQVYAGTVDGTVYAFGFAMERK